MRKTIIILITAVSAFHLTASGQPGFSFELKKPQKFENKKLGSEKTAEKKFTAPRRFMQNTITHYNYYFNANNKIKEIIARAKSVHRDDFTRLLPFYNYSLQTTAEEKTDLDSVIYKSTAGVLIHDLRNDWIDNLYLLIGKAYYLKNELDSAYLTFQYVNYAFSPKEKDGYDKVIGSNQNEGGNAFSVSTKESGNIVDKVFSQPPSRNESFIWQIRTYLARDEFAEAAGLIETLRNDPLFPKRLEPDLEEMRALFFYKQQMFDSAAIHLEKALANAENNQERARWEYLIGQMHEMSGKNEMAEKFFNRSIRHTLDPVMEVYARLNAIRQNKSAAAQSIQTAVNELLKMARKDRYFMYRDIIYYTAGVIEMERDSLNAASELFLKSVKSNIDNAPQRSTSYLALAGLAFDQRHFPEAKNFYDSVEVQYVMPADSALYTERKMALETIVQQIKILQRQDSLQRIAAMPVAERNAYLEKLSRQLRRQQGFKDDSTSGPLEKLRGNNAGAGDLFAGSSKGDWYFSNASLKAKGLTEFKVKWGTRSNVDNWRREAAVTGSLVSSGENDPGDLTSVPVEVSKAITVEALLERLPLTPEKQKISNDSVENALFTLGKSYMNGIEDYHAAIREFEDLLANFPSSIHVEEAWFSLYYCYRKTGNLPGEAKAKQVLNTQYADGQFTAMLNRKNMAESPDSIQKMRATQIYEDIYNLFIEGKFTEALNQKMIADSTYGQNYWTPQLLYIEAVYYIRQRDDTAATRVLMDIIQLFPSSPIFAKTQTLLEVLSRRAEIEAYLTNLNLQEDQENVAARKKEPVREPVIEDTPAPVTPPAQDSLDVQPPSDTAAADIPTQSPDTVAAEPPADTIAAVADEPVKDANAASVRNQDVAVAKPTVGAKPVGARRDSVQVIRKPEAKSLTYTNNPAEPHYVLLVLDKVDPVYTTEARNAFNRYHRERYADKNIEITTVPFSEDIKLLQMTNYDNAADAFDYIDKTRKLTNTEIIPWLTTGKYSFLMITPSNLNVLNTTKDITAYQKFLKQLYPELF